MIINKKCCRTVTLLILVLLLPTGIYANACSGYVVYKDDEVYYGMNWDYNPIYDATLSVKTILPSSLTQPLHWWGTINNI